jgi:hypothetical protein
LQIERVQNPGLYAKYMSRKALLDSQNPGIDNEKTLWHGTPAENIASINKKGFDPSRCKPYCMYCMIQFNFLF